jgi:hypothetical protein
MRMKVLSFLVVLSISVSGCTEPSSDDVAFGQRRLLGQEFDTFEPPVKPMETADVSKIAEPTGVISLRDALALALMGNPKKSAAAVHAAVLMEQRQLYN